MLAAAMQPLRIVYLLLCLVGALWTWSHNLAFMAAHPGPFAAAAFVREAFSTPAGASLSADILVAGAAGSTWMVVEARRLGMRFVWAYVALGMMVAFACAFPLFLFVREGALARDGARA
jgi:hypothetical protein